MNHRLMYLLSLGLCAVLLLTGCSPEDGTVIPITGAEDSIPASVTRARDDVLAYLADSSRLTVSPPNANWQLDSVEQHEGEYHFHSGDWHMVIHLANGTHKDQQIVIINPDENTYWCGYVKVDGQVIDTTYVH